MEVSVEDLRRKLKNEEAKVHEKQQELAAHNENIYAERMGWQAERASWSGERTDWQAQRAVLEQRIKELTSDLQVLEGEKKKISLEKQKLCIENQKLNASIAISQMPSMVLKAEINQELEKQIREQKAKVLHQEQELNQLRALSEHATFRYAGELLEAKNVHPPSNAYCLCVIVFAAEYSTSARLRPLGRPGQGRSLSERQSQERNIRH